jgi:hypothetical protein
MFFFFFTGNSSIKYSLFFKSIRYINWCEDIDASILLQSIRHSVHKIKRCLNSKYKNELSLPILNVLIFYIQYKTTVQLLLNNK